jgi:iron complex transport system substrate-binding protein
VLVALLAAALVACGGAPTPTAPTTPTTPKAAPTSGGTAAFPVTIEHAFGSTTIPAAPQRVVTIGFNEADFALALGVVPVGVRDFIGEYAEESRPWAQEALGGATPEVVGRNELELEKIAALQPDVILGVYSFIDRATYERLSGIAPTVAPPSETVAATWQEQTRLTGRALGLTERAEQVVADTEARFAAARAANPEFAGKTLAAGFVVGGETYALGTDDLRTQLFTDLGFTARHVDHAEPGSCSVSSTRTCWSSSARAGPPPRRTSSSRRCERCATAAWRTSATSRRRSRAHWASAAR